MLDTIYSYRGTITEWSCNTSKSGCSTADFVVHVLCNDNIPPMRLQAYGDIVDYLNDLEGCDDEERYFPCEWCFDSMLYLRYIIVPAYDSDCPIPAKIIAQTEPCFEDGWNGHLMFFGPKEYINDLKPQPMSSDEWNRWYDFKGNGAGANWGRAIRLFEDTPRKPSIDLLRDDKTRRRWEYDYAMLFTDGHAESFEGVVMDGRLGLLDAVKEAQWQVQRHRETLGRLGSKVQECRITRLNLFSPTGECIYDGLEADDD